jgi:hypothetical protein
MTLQFKKVAHQTLPVGRIMRVCCTGSPPKTARPVPFFSLKSARCTDWPRQNAEQNGMEEQAIQSNPIKSNPIKSKQSKAKQSSNKKNQSSNGNNQSIRSHSATCPSDSLGWTSKGKDSAFGWTGKQDNSAWWPGGKAIRQHSNWLDVLPDKQRSIGATQQFAGATPLADKRWQLSIWLDEQARNRGASGK